MEEQITVLTPTYNRANLLPRAFESLCNQTCKNFVWLIVDDGSKDDTKEVVKKLKDKSDFKIIYKYKKNEGKHIAVNYSYDFMNTEWMIFLDDDDILVDDAIEKANKLILELKKRSDYNEIWQISGRCLDYKTGKIMGKLFPDNINKVGKKKQEILRARCYGEKHGLRKVEILKQYLFPKYDDTNFVTENQIWYKIDLRYKTYCTNEAFIVYYYTEDSLTHAKYNKAMHRTFYHFSIFCLNELTSQMFYKKDVFKSIFNVPRRALKTGIKYKTVMKDLSKWYIRVIVTLIGYPIAYLYIKIKDKD